MKLKFFRTIAPLLLLAGCAGAGAGPASERGFFTGIGAAVSGEDVRGAQRLESSAALQERRLSGCAPNARKTQPQRPKVPGCNRNWMRWNGSAAPQQRAPAGHRLIRCKASNAARANLMLLCSALGGFEPDAGLKPVLALMAIRGRP